MFNALDNPMETLCKLVFLFIMNSTSVSFLHRYATIWVIEIAVTMLEKQEARQVDFSQEEIVGNKAI